jgi:hypothetical protein
MAKRLRPRYGDILLLTRMAIYMNRYCEECYEFRVQPDYVT